MIRLLLLSLVLTVGMGIYEFRVPGLSGGTINFEDYKERRSSL